MLSALEAHLLYDRNCQNYEDQVQRIKCLSFTNTVYFTKVEVSELLKKGSCQVNSLIKINADERLEIDWSWCDASSHQIV